MCGICVVKVESPQRRAWKREQEERGGGGGAWTSLGPTGAPIVLRSHHFWRWGQKKGARRRKGGKSEERPGIVGVVTGPPGFSPPLVGVVWTPKAEAGAAERSTRGWGFLPQLRDCHRTAFQSSWGLVLLRFQVCIQGELASLSPADFPLPGKCLYEENNVSLRDGSF